MLPYKCRGHPSSSNNGNQFAILPNEVQAPSANELQQQLQQLRAQMNGLERQLQANDMVVLNMTVVLLHPVGEIRQLLRLNRGKVSINPDGTKGHDALCIHLRKDNINL